MFNRFNDFVYSSLKNIVDIKKYYNINIEGDTKIIDTIYKVDFNGMDKYIAIVNYNESKISSPDILNLMDFLSIDVLLLFEDSNCVLCYHTGIMELLVSGNKYFTVDLDFFKINGNDLKRLFPSDEEDDLKTSNSFSKQDDYIPLVINKIYLVKRIDIVNYSEYSSCIVVAKNETQALQIAQKSCNNYYNGFTFREDTVKIEEISIEEPRMIIAEGCGDVK